MLAEYDAVPGLGHACGHNIISASMVAALTAVLPSIGELSGRFSIFGTPAEEGGGGKMIMWDHHAFDDVDAVLMFHPKDINTVGQTTFALTPVSVEFYGHSVNASSFPFQGVNALDALVNSYVAISTLRQQLRADARIHGIFTHAGVAPNNIPDYTRAEYYCRATEKAYVAELVEKVKNCARGAALQTGCRVEFPEPDRPAYDPIKPNPVLVDLMKRNTRGLDIPLIEDEPVLTASNDAGTLSQSIPTTLLTLAIGPRPFGEHSPEFAAAAIAPAGDAALFDAAKVLAMTAVDLLSEPRLVEDARREL
jgi:amidohydrolase